MGNWHRRLHRHTGGGGGVSGGGGGGGGGVAGYQLGFAGTTTVQDLAEMFPERFKQQDEWGGKRPPTDGCCWRTRRRCGRKAPSQKALGRPAGAGNDRSQLTQAQACLPTTKAFSDRSVSQCPPFKQGALSRLACDLRPAQSGRPGRHFRLSDQAHPRLQSGSFSMRCASSSLPSAARRKDKTPGLPRHADANLFFAGQGAAPRPSHSHKLIIQIHQ